MNKPVLLNVPRGLLAKVKSNAKHSAFTPDEWFSFQQREARADYHRQQEQLAAERQQRDVKKLLERSGVQDIYLSATLESYQIYRPEQKAAISTCRDYLQSFGQYGAVKNMVFCGSTGTGKNHMASSICNALNVSGKSAAVATAFEIQMKARASRSYDSPLTEEKVIASFAAVDLLVLDEIELGSTQDYDIKIINAVIDQRVTKGKSTVVLTNMKLDDLANHMGERIADRLFSSFYLVECYWPSYRTNKPAGAMA
ncbi:ATP-binding protein [Rheinheimera sp. MMS21-TC3]|uniref:ATP-binding protein n=1 Tax=Rheinheimera sp. MMS21-TC3 TaxID=3072790 RepID=UPI0028C3B171|nr:ATP-binding protein [Rheinheimera sp. MMS21-TC3]WNO60867.1 ATP-binding protein [Rheinheimera sp. MMS21-TC3]